MEQQSGGSSSGLTAFVGAIVGYTLMNRVLVGRGSSTRPKAMGEGGQPSTLPLPTRPPHPYNVGLLDLTVPREDKSSFPQVLIANDLAIEKTIQEVGGTLYVYLHDEAMSQGGGAAGCTGDARGYLSDLYDQFWDLCYLHKNLHLDVRILWQGGATAGPTAFRTREDCLMDPRLEAVFSYLAQGDASLVNDKRRAKGHPLLTHVSLKDHVKAVMDTSFDLWENGMSTIPSFRQVVLGGTFDRLHNGHKKLLTLGGNLCLERLTIGVTSSVMLAKKQNASLIASAEDRVALVRNFLTNVFPQLKVNVVVIEDPFGPPIHEENFDAIVVSSETIPGANKINEIRASKGMRPLRIIVTRRMLCSMLSSSFIRDNIPLKPGGP